MDMDTTLPAKISSIVTGVCHRGLHDLDKPENSIAAFRAAIEAHLPFECDVHLTKDGRILVCHDSDLTRMCHKPGIIEELTFDEIREGYSLPDGSKLMEFSELLDLNHGQVPMVIELKAYGDNAASLAQATIPLVNAMPNVDHCYVISFSADALREARKLNCVPPLGFLVGTEAVKHASKELLEEFDFLDVEVHYSLLPRFRRYRKKGGALMCWTVKNKLTYRIGKRRCHCLTWEKVDSSKEKNEVNRFVEKKLDPRY